jgi:L-aminopeptidase/D-esterase-like protein
MNPIRTGVILGSVLAWVCALVWGQESSKGLTAVEGIKVGHHTLSERPTGCTVVLAEAGAVGGVDVRGSAPGTRETDLLDPINTVEEVHAVVLSGGSAFGLDAASGVMRFLEERGVGFDVGVAKVPIVPAAILFDLRVGDKPEIRPGPDCGYKAAMGASDGPVEEGNVGAGAGATVGKVGERGLAMKGGVGTAAFSYPNGLVVAALVAVNAAGDVIDPATGRVIAGVRTEDGKGLADVRKLLRSGATLQPASAQHTTIGVVATNARLTKAQANKLAQMAHDGLARAISPAHTPGDGDTLFALATGTWEGEVNLTTLGALAAEATADAIVRSVRAAKGIPGYPSASDLAPAPQ